MEDIDVQEIADNWAKSLKPSYQADITGLSWRSAQCTLHDITPLGGAVATKKLVFKERFPYNYPDGADVATCTFQQTVTRTTATRVTVSRRIKLGASAGVNFGLSAFIGGKLQVNGELDLSDCRETTVESIEEWACNRTYPVYPQTVAVLEVLVDVKPFQKNFTSIGEIKGRVTAVNKSGNIKREVQVAELLEEFKRFDRNGFERLTENGKVVGVKVTVTGSIEGEVGISSEVSLSQEKLTVKPDAEPHQAPPQGNDGQPRPNVYNINIYGNPNLVNIGDGNMLMNAPMSTGKKVKDAVKNAYQNSPDDNVGDETVNTNAVLGEQDPPDANVGDETVNTNAVLEEQDPPDDNVGDETVNTNVVEEQDPPDDNVGDETVNTNVVAVDQNNATVAVDGPDRSLAVIQPGDTCREIISKIGGQGDITNVDCIAFAEALVTYLNLDRTSVETPPKEIMGKCQKLCCFLKQKGRLDIFEKLKTLLQNGMTGPRRDYEGVFQELPVDEQLNLTEAMTGNDKLLENLITELLGKSASQIDFYKRQQNPAEKILKKICQKRRLLVGELYNILVRYGAPALADEYL